MQLFEIREVEIMRVDCISINRIKYFFVTYFFSLLSIGLLILNTVKVYSFILSHFIGFLSETRPVQNVPYRSMLDMQ